MYIFVSFRAFTRENSGGDGPSAPRGTFHAPGQYWLNGAMNIYLYVLLRTIRRTIVTVVEY